MCRTHISYMYLTPYVIIMMACVDVMHVSMLLRQQFAMMETVITAIVDEFPMLRIGKRKIVFTGLLCIFLFLLGLPQCANVS